MTKQKRIWNKYLFKVANKVERGGITTNLEQRESQHRQKWPKGHIAKVGRRTTKSAALRWEREQGFQANAPD